MESKKFLDKDSLLGDKVRLAIMATVAAAEEPMDFSTLLETLELTRGNLSSHMRKLEEGELIEVQKEFVDRRPRTTYHCTERGRGELKDYLKHIEDMLKATT